MKYTEEEQERGRDFNFIYFEALNPDYLEEYFIEMKRWKMNFDNCIYCNKEINRSIYPTSEYCSASCRGKYRREKNGKTK